MKKKRAGREKFLGELERTVQWARLMVVVEPLYPKRGASVASLSGFPGRCQCTDAAVVRPGRRDAVGMRCTTARRCGRWLSVAEAPAHVNKGGPFTVAAVLRVWSRRPQHRRA